MENEIPQCLVYMDKLRMKQVIDNVVNNSYKYAGTDIHVSFKIEENICITIRDSGAGVPDEELALVTEKYYRGSNAKGKSGSGIGLYLCKTFMKQMGGDMEYYNNDGFVVELVLKKV
jgi:signal transduction histidine kinase